MYKSKMAAAQKRLKERFEEEVESFDKKRRSLGSQFAERARSLSMSRSRSSNDMHADQFPETSSSSSPNLQINPSTSFNTSTSNVNQERSQTREEKRPNRFIKRHFSAPWQPFSRGPRSDSNFNYQELDLNPNSINNNNNNNHQPCFINGQLYDSRQTQGHPISSDTSTDALIDSFFRAPEEEDYRGRTYQQENSYARSRSSDSDRSVQTQIWIGEQSEIEPDPVSDHQSIGTNSPVENNPSICHLSSRASSKNRRNRNVSSSRHSTSTDTALLAELNSLLLQEVTPTSIRLPDAQTPLQNSTDETVNRVRERARSGEYKLFGDLGKIDEPSRRGRSRSSTILSRETSGGRSSSNSSSGSSGASTPTSPRSEYTFPPVSASSRPQEQSTVYGMSGNQLDLNHLWNQVQEVGPATTFLLWTFN